MYINICLNTEAKLLRASYICYWCQQGNAKYYFLADKRVDKRKHKDLEESKKSIQVSGANVDSIFSFFIWSEKKVTF